MEASEQGLSIECFLRELTAEGSLDSQGQFTLALEHAREKLAKFLLSSSQDYLLKLIQAGVAAGSRQLELKTGSTRVRMTSAFGATTPIASPGPGPATISHRRRQ